MKLLLNLLAISVALFWLTPLLCALGDILAWLLLSHGMTGIEWTPLRVVVTFAWTAAGLWVFAQPAIFLADEAAKL